MAPSTTGYAATAYMATQTQAMSPQQVLLALYDFAIAGCVARDARKTSAALVELIAALDFRYEEIATGFYRLYEYALREVKADRFDGAQRILTDLRDTWQVAFSRTTAGAVAE
jgi:flagellin-specific chaperone FliS